MFRLPCELIFWFLVLLGYWLDVSCGIVFIWVLLLELECVCFVVFLCGCSFELYLLC